MIDAFLWQNVMVITLQGTAFAPHGCQPPGIHTTLNKLRLLFHAIDRGEENEFDQDLMLDADTVLSNMQVGVRDGPELLHDLVMAKGLVCPAPDAACLEEGLIVVSTP
jgi:hypothetical protein